MFKNWFVLQWYSFTKIPLYSEHAIIKAHLRLIYIVIFHCCFKTRLMFINTQSSQLHKLGSNISQDLPVTAGNKFIATKKHFYWIDLFRFISAFLVLLTHYRGMFFVEYGLLPENQHHTFIQIFYLLTRFGEQPVIVFFVLSGFLVGGKAIENIFNNNVNLRSYFIDRFVRIFLPLIASSILVIIIDLITGASIPFFSIMGSFFSLQGVFTSVGHNPPLWSLSYEVWFYIMMGCIMAISVKKISSNKLILCFIILSLCIYFFTRLNATYLLIWFMGAFAYLLPRENITHKKWKIVSLIALLGLAFILQQSVTQSRSVKINIANFLDIGNTSIFLALITCLLVRCLITAEPKQRVAIKIEKIGSKLADFSYTLYLTHYPLMYLLAYYGFPKSKQVNSQSVFLYILSLIIGVTVAYLIYLVSEKHTYKMKQIIKSVF